MNDLYKKKPTDKTMWKDDPEKQGEFEFTFDGKKFYNLFADYPQRLTPEEKRIFDSENPYWANFFKSRG